MLGAVDLNNKCDDINSVYISIYTKENDIFFDYKIESIGKKGACLSGPFYVFKKLLYAYVALHITGQNGAF